MAYTVKLLNDNHYYVDEASLESESIYIQFDGMYSFRNMPKGFNIVDTNCYDCPTDGHCRMDGSCERDSYKPKTILVYTKPDYCKTTEQLQEISIDLYRWVWDLFAPEYLRAGINAFQV